MKITVIVDWNPNPGDWVKYIGDTISNKLLQGIICKVQDVHVCDICGEKFLDVGIKRPKTRKGNHYRPVDCPVCHCRVDDGTNLYETGIYWLSLTLFEPTKQK